MYSRSAPEHVKIFVHGYLVLFGRPGDSALSQPKVLESSAQGMLIELPFVATGQEMSWHPQWTPASAATRQQVLQALSEYSADYKQLRTLLEVQPGPGSATLEQLSQRIGDALARYHLGRMITGDDRPIDTLPADLTLPENGLLLICAEEDSELALRLLAALSPYLSGMVSVRFDTKITAQSMRLYLFGAPYFNDQGHATFDDVTIKNSAVKQKSGGVDG